MGFEDLGQPGDATGGFKRGRRVHGAAVVRETAVEGDGIHERGQDHPDVLLDAPDTRRTDEQSGLFSSEGQRAHQRYSFRDRVT